MPFLTCWPSRRGAVSVAEEPRTLLEVDGHRGLVVEDAPAGGLLAAGLEVRAHLVDEDDRVLEWSKRSLMRRKTLPQARR
jgi:hypothetical protein